MSGDPRLKGKAAQARSASGNPPPDLPLALSSKDHDNEKNGSDGYMLRFCTVCANNQNRSMETHLRLSLAGYPVVSFGTGSQVRLPGPSAREPNVYSFNAISYDSMFNELQTKDEHLYRTNGVLKMLDRNRSIKEAPERWQDWRIGVPRLNNSADKGARGMEGGYVDVVITCEERCWDTVVDDLLIRGGALNRPVHIINVDIVDRPEDAIKAGDAIIDLADSLNKSYREERAQGSISGWNVGTGPERAGFDDRVPEILAEWQERWPKFSTQWTLGWL